MQKEAKARIKINTQLQKAGWRFFDDANGKANIVLENHTILTQHHFDAFGNDFEKTKHGYIDFLLLDKNGFPYAVLEAKSEDKSPLDGKEQARLNLQEGWWRLFRHDALAGQSFANPDEIEQATRVATAQLNRRAKPWIWGRPRHQIIATIATSFLIVFKERSSRVTSNVHAQYSAAACCMAALTCS